MFLSYIDGAFVTQGSRPARLPRQRRRAARDSAPSRARATRPTRGRQIAVLKRSSFRRPPRRARSRPSTSRGAPCSPPRPSAPSPRCRQDGAAHRPRELAACRVAGDHVDLRRRRVRVESAARPSSGPPSPDRRGTPRRSRGLLRSRSRARARSSQSLCPCFFRSSFSASRLRASRRSSQNLLEEFLQLDEPFGAHAVQAPGAVASLLTSPASFNTLRCSDTAGDSRRSANAISPAASSSSRTSPQDPAAPGLGDRLECGFHRRYLSICLRKNQLTNRLRSRSPVSRPDRASGARGGEPAAAG